MPSMDTAGCVVKIFLIGQHSTRQSAFHTITVHSMIQTMAATSVDSAAVDVKCHSSIKLAFYIICKSPTNYTTWCHKNVGPQKQIFKSFKN